MLNGSEHTYCIATDALKLHPVKTGRKFLQCDVTNNISTTTRLVLCRAIFVIGTVGMLWADKASDCSYTEVQQWNWHNTLSTGNSVVTLVSTPLCILSSGHWHTGRGEGRGTHTNKGCFVHVCQNKQKRKCNT